MRNRYPPPPAPTGLVMITATIDQVTPTGVTWEYGGRIFGPSPLIIAPAPQLAQDGDPPHRHTVTPPSLERRPCKVLVNEPNYADSVVIPLAKGTREWFA